MGRKKKGERGRRGKRGQRVTKHIFIHRYCFLIEYPPRSTPSSVPTYIPEPALAAYIFTSPVLAVTAKLLE